MSLKLGLNTGLLGLGTAVAGGAARREGGRAPRLRLDLDVGGLRLRRADAAGLVGRPDRARQARHGDHADERAPPDRGGDGRDDDGPPERRPLRARARRVGPAGRRGLVRRAVREAARAHARVRRRSCATWSPGGRRSPPTARTTRSRSSGREGITGLGKPLKSTLHPLRERIPICLGAEGPKNIALAAEIADGWLALFYSPYHDAELYRPCLEEGFARRERPHDDFEIARVGPVHRPRRRRAGGGHDAPDVRPVLRRDGGPRA